jgi:hypothetical protein
MLIWQICILQMIAITIFFKNHYLPLENTSINSQHMFFVSSL